MLHQTVTPAPQTPAMLRCDRVSKIYGAVPRRLDSSAISDLSDQELRDRGLVPAVRDASFDVARGETFVIMGLSGSGKSTLVRCLTRLVEPTCGRVEVDGIDVTSASDKLLIDIRRQKMGMVFQHFALLPNKSVLGNILFPMRIQGIDRQMAERRSRELVALVGLSGLETRRPAELSGGQQQRVGIARSLATDPPVWFLDEPFSALDPLIRADLQDELLRLQSAMAKTTVFITHDLDEAIRLGDRIAIMEAGRIVQIGAAEDLVLRPAGDYVRRFVAKVPLAKVVRIASLMTYDRTYAGSGPIISASATVESIAHLAINGPDRFAVVDSTGTVSGSVDKIKILNILAGLRMEHDQPV